MKGKERIEKLPCANLVVIGRPYEMNNAYEAKYQKHKKEKPLPGKHIAIVGQTKVQCSPPTFTPEDRVPSTDKTEKTIGPIWENQAEN